MCFKFDLREVLDIKDFLKETTSAPKLRFACNCLTLTETRTMNLFKLWENADYRSP